MCWYLPVSKKHYRVLMNLFDARFTLCPHYLLCSYHTFSQNFGKDDSVVNKGKANRNTSGTTTWRRIIHSFHPAVDTLYYYRIAVALSSD